jgi:hypothetical protein
MSQALGEGMACICGEYLAWMVRETFAGLRVHTAGRPCYTPTPSYPVLHPPRASTPPDPLSVSQLRVCSRCSVSLPFYRWGK